eukprot:TRINITY_DN20562_c0_g1_i1.p1 TRINITY_DN20562_c0_g1~~TRINITY_DN20562_c0_g1_i1.p1  ORF type:complete len:284 (+),score=37.84 TRINITY_DN20562_c0_g1_i1:29-880(+)
MGEGQGATSKEMTIESEQQPPSVKVLSVNPIYLLIAAVIVTVGTFAITYPVSIYVCKYRETCLGDQNEYFLSNSINYPYASNMGAFGLTFGAVLLFIVMVIQYLIVCDKISLLKESLQTEKIAFAAVCCGAASSVGAIGVISFQIHSLATIHYIAAALFFGAGLVSLALFAWVQFLLDNRTLAGISPKVRLASVAVSILVSLGWIIAFGVIDSDTTEYAIIAATFEIVMFICFEVILLTWAPDFAKKTMRVCVPTRDPAPAEDSPAEVEKPTESTRLWTGENP